MKVRISFLLAMLLVLSPLRAQEVDIIVGDSISLSADTILTDSLVVASLAADSLVADSMKADTMMVDSIPFLDTIVTTLPDNHAFIIAWCKNYPLGEVRSDALWRAAADTDNLSALLQSMDTVPYNPALSYAQTDIRLPMFVGNEVPDKQSELIGQSAQRQMELMGKPKVLEGNVFQRQLDNASIRQQALFRYSSRNLRSMSHYRGDHSDFQTERRRIERNDLTGDEHVKTNMGLDLETTGLKLDKVTFHADKWHRRGTTELQVSQTALSDNWYRSGDNNMTIFNYDKLVFSRYDESKKTTLDISLELRLSGYYTKADTIHPMRVNDNQFRADVSYGYKAWKNWYYSSTAYLKTPIFEFFNANSNQVKSNFFSPLEFNVAVGMDLKLNKDKRFNYSLMLAPLSYNMKSIADDRVPVSVAGIEPGKTSLHQVGASVTSKMEWQVSEAVTWISRAYFFTSYHNIQLEFENTFNIILGRYSTAKLYLYPRFDDGIDSKVQMKEMLTFGLAFGW